MALEVLAVLAAPIVVYVVLRLRGMAPLSVTDPSMHTTFIVDPRDIFLRYQQVFASTARMREAARVGFLVPARLSYLLFGAVPGFFVFRYLLALIAVVPVYLLLRRLYGRSVGFAGIAIVMSSPVVVTAWGTDYPDSATMSYLIGGLALLALSWQSRRPARLLILSGALLTLAVWSLSDAVPLVGALAVSYVGLRLVRQRAHLGPDVALAALSGVAVTGLLTVGSKLLIGQWNFITPTIRAAEVLSEPFYVHMFHSTSWAWAPYDPYLLVPPVVLVAFVVVFMRRWREIDSTVLFIGLATALQLAVVAYLQFLGSVELLEAYHFSSALWSSVTIMLALIVAELLHPLLGPSAADSVHLRLPARRWGVAAVEAVRGSRLVLPTALVLGVALIYEATPHGVPSMSWGHGGAIVAGALLAAAALGRMAINSSRSAPSAPARGRQALQLVVVVAVVVVVGSALVLTVAPGSPHGPLAGTVVATAPEPSPPYADALGGSAAPYIDEYSVTSQLPAFVGPPAYRGEQLLIWWPRADLAALYGPLGIYHGAFNTVTPLSFPTLDAYGSQRIEARHAAQVLIMSTTGDHFEEAVRSLAMFNPVVIRRGVLSDGTYHLHLWLVDLKTYIRTAPG